MIKEWWRVFWLFLLPPVLKRSARSLQSFPEARAACIALTLGLTQPQNWFWIAILLTSLPKHCAISEKISTYAPIETGACVLRKKCEIVLTLATDTKLAQARKHDLTWINSLSSSSIDCINIWLDKTLWVHEQILKGRLRDVFSEAFNHLWSFVNICSDRDATLYWFAKEKRR